MNEWMKMGEGEGNKMPGANGNRGLRDLNHFSNIFQEIVLAAKLGAGTVPRHTLHLRYLRVATSCRHVPRVAGMCSMSGPGGARDGSYIRGCWHLDYIPT